MGDIPSDLRIDDNAEAQRYELWSGARLLGFAEYRSEPGRRLFPYVEIDPVLQGRGLGGILTAAALDDCRRRGLEVEATCPFVVAYLRDHPEYDDIVAS